MERERQRESWVRGERERDECERWACLIEERERLMREMSLPDGGDRERDVDGCWLQQSTVVGMWCPLNCRGGVCAQCVCVCVQ